MLLALVSGFALSQAFRTITAIMATGLQAEFGLSAQALGVFAGHLSRSPRHHAVFRASPSISGAFGAPCWWRFRWRLQAALSAVATGYSTLLLGQVLIGAAVRPPSGVHGVHRPLLCAVALRRRASGAAGPVVGMHHRHAAGVAGGAIVVALGFGGAGGLAALAWALIFWKVREPRRPMPTRPPCNARIAGPDGARVRALFLLPHTVGISCWR